MRRPHLSIPLLPKSSTHSNPGFHTHSDEPIVAGSMQVRFRVEARRCHLSRELEAHSAGAVAGRSGFPRYYYLKRKLHTILGKGLKTSPVVHRRCSSTANFRATAITARFLPALPSLLDKPHCRSAESLPQCPRM